MKTQEVIPSTTVGTEEPVAAQKAEKKAGKRIGYYYIIVKSLKKSRKNDVVKCIYIKGLARFGFCVIKEGSMGESRDAEGRDIRDRLKWQEQLHGRLQHKVKMPGLHGSFEENGNYYLVMDYIRGKPLHKVFREKGVAFREQLLTGGADARRFWGYMIQLADLLVTLHQNHIIHRDVTANNFMVTPEGRVVVIDMELSYSTKENFPAPPFQLGTYGYMSPEQEAMLPPVAQDDIYAVGAILVNAFTGISPSKVMRDPPELIRQRVLFFIPDEALADIILRCLHEDPMQRFSAAELKAALLAYQSGTGARQGRAAAAPAMATKEEVLEKVQQVVATLGSPLLCAQGRGWFAENTSRARGDQQQPDKAWYASFSQGAAGIMYMLAKARRVGIDISPCAVGIEAGSRLITAKYLQRVDVVQPGLFSGADGVALALYTMWKEELAVEIPDTGRYISLMLGKPTERPGFANGMAGQGMAGLICAPLLDQLVLRERLSCLARSIIRRQGKDGSWNLGRTGKTAHFTRGFASGAAGMTYFLLEYARWADDAGAANSAGAGLHWLNQKSYRAGNEISWRSSAGKALRQGWNDGGAGIALPFIRAYALYGNEAHRQTAEAALSFVFRHIQGNSLSLRDGLVGAGEVFLEAFRVFGDELWLRRAAHVARVMLLLAKKAENNSAYWLLEHEKQPVPGFVAGNSGALHFLLRFACPDMIQFPLLH